MFNIVLFVFLVNIAAAGPLGCAACLTTFGITCAATCIGAGPLWAQCVLGACAGGLGPFCNFICALPTP